MTLVERMREGRGKGSYIGLLISLAALFLLYPVMLELGLVRQFRFFFLLVLVAAVFSLSDRRRHLIVALCLAVPTAIGQAAAYASPSPAVLMFASSVALLFIVYVVVIVLSGVLRAGRVDGDKIAGAIVAYLLLGLAWAMVYALIALLEPGAFRGAIPQPLENGMDTGHEYGFIYYSFVTLTTLGYGDISPASSFARVFAWIEAATGQLYIAVLVARLVALQIMHGAIMDKESS